MQTVKKAHRWWKRTGKKIDRCCLISAYPCCHTSHWRDWRIKGRAGGRKRATERAKQTVTGENAAIDVGGRRRSHSFPGVDECRTLEEEWARRSGGTGVDPRSSPWTLHLTPVCSPAPAARQTEEKMGSSVADVKTENQLEKNHDFSL